MECEIAKVYEVEEVTARKKHKCCECSSPILKNEIYLKVFGVWSWGKATFRQHLICAEACMEIRDNFNDGECIGFGCLQEEFDAMRWQYDRHGHPKHVASWKRLRDLMAKILRRERAL